MEIEVKKNKIANIISNLSIIFLFVITAYTIFFYSSSDVQKYYFYFFAMINMLEVLMFISIGVLMVVTKYSVYKSIAFTKSIFSLMIYALIVVLIFMCFPYTA